eukprot:6206020-Pleurochrysis_carterae.AAC.1
MLTFRSVRHCGASITQSDTKARRRVRDRPVAVGVRDELISSVALVLDALVRRLRHVGQHAIGMFIYLLRGKGQRARQDPDRECFSWSATRWSVN